MFTPPAHFPVLLCVVLMVFLAKEQANNPILHKKYLRFNLNGRLVNEPGQNSRLRFIGYKSII